jgi:GTP-binding protein EngB required for normal cell division
MTVANRVRPGTPAEFDADSLAARVDGLRRFLRAAEDHLPEQRLAGTRTVLDRTGERLALSAEHTVVALAGTTGSGKSSLFNAMARMNLSQVGVRRPTTGVAHACVWGSVRSSAGAGPLLDWLGVPPSRRFERESALDGEDEAALRGLVLLDLPDFDSVEETHRIEVDRLLGLVDLVVWVLDPQKYADNTVHNQYLAQLKRYRDITVVVLNQADLLSPGDAHRCVLDLRKLLDADGLTGVPAFATSAVAARGLNQLRTLLERTVAARFASLYRLAGDVAGAVEDLAPLVAAEPIRDPIDYDTERALDDALATAGGVPAVVAATQRAYHHRAVAAMGWPVLRWLRRLRPDPLRRLHLGRSTGTTDPVPATSVPAAGSAEQAAVALAVRTLAERAGADLPQPWPTAVMSAARSRLSDLPDAIDVAIARTDLGMARAPLWWRLVGVLQWLASLTALVGLAWLGVRLVLFAFGVPLPLGPRVGPVPLPTALLFGGLLAGVLVGALVRPLVDAGSRRVRAKAERRLRTAVSVIARDYVVTPVREVLGAYGEARRALLAAAGRD